MDKLKPVPYATRCRCGNALPKAATARWDAKDRLWYDCHICRPRPAAHDGLEGEKHVAIAYDGRGKNATSAKADKVPAAIDGGQQGRAGCQKSLRGAVCVSRNASTLNK